MSIHTNTLDRTLPPAFQEIREVHLAKAVSQTLKNGIRLHWVNAGEQPIVRIECIFQAGNWYETHKGASYFTVKMLNEGTSRMTAAQINEYADQFGAFLEFNHGQDKVNITLYVLNKHLEKLLPLLVDILTDSIFPEAELENLKTITLQNLQVNREKTAFLAQNRFRELLFGPEHPYGRNLDETDINQTSPDILRDHYGKRLKEQPFDVILSGLVTDQTLALVSGHLANLSVAETPSSVLFAPVLPAEPQHDVVEKAGSVQSSIRFGKRLFTRKHPDYFKLLVLNEVFGGYFGSRLMKNIREDKGFTYGIHSSVVTFGREGYLTVGTDVKREFTDQTLTEITKEMNILQTEPVSEEELQTVQSYMIGSFAGSITTPFALADHFKTIYFDGLGYDFFEKYIDNIRSTTAQDLLELANKYFSPDSFTEVVAGGK